MNGAKYAIADFNLTRESQYVHSHFYSTLVVLAKRQDELLALSTSIQSAIDDLDGVEGSETAAATLTAALATINTTEAGNPFKAVLDKLDSLGLSGTHATVALTQLFGARLSR